MSQPDRDQPDERQPDERQPDERQPDNGAVSGHDQDREPPAAGTPGESNTWAMPDVHTRDAAVERRPTESPADSDDG